MSTMASTPLAAVARPLDLVWHMGAPALSTDPDALSPERMRPRFNGMRETGPKANVWRGPSPIGGLGRALRDDVDALSFVPLGSDAPIRWDASLAANHTDGIMVLHRGRLAYERHDGLQQAHRPHLSVSVTKSLVGTLAAAEMVAGPIDPEAPVPAYVTELTEGGWDPKAEMVIARFASHPAAASAHTDPTTLPAYHALAFQLLASP